MTDTMLPPALSGADYLAVPLDPAAGLLVDIAPFGDVRAWTGTAPLAWGAGRLALLGNLGKVAESLGLGAPVDWREHDLRPTSSPNGDAWIPLAGYGSTPANIGIEWTEPRDVYAVIVHYSAGMAPRPEDVDLQYWWWSWPEPAAPFERTGWTRIDDKWCGYWRSADDHITVDGATHAHIFAPLSTAEIAHAEGVTVPFRRTLKVRLAYHGAAAIAISRLRAFTNSRWQELGLRLEMGRDGRHACWDGEIVPVNGIVRDLQPLGFAAEDRVLTPHRWQLATQGAPKGLQLRLLATDAPPDNGDRTIVTLRTARHSCSFRTYDLTRDGAIDVQEYGIRIEQHDTGAGQVAPQSVDVPIIDSVLARPEQSLERAVAEIPAPEKTKQTTPGARYVPLAADTNRYKFALQYNGNVFCDRDLIKPKPDHDEQALWPAERIAYRFGSGAQPDFREGEHAATQTVLDDCLPVVQTRWEDGGIAYEQEAFASLLYEGLSHEERKRGDEPAVLLLQFTARNIGSTPGHAQVWLQVQLREALVVENGAILAAGSIGQDEVAPYARPRLRMQVLRGASAVQPAPIDGAVADAARYTCELAPGQTDRLVVAIPFITIMDDAGRAAVRALDYEAKRAEAVAYWRARIDAGVRIEVPEETINSFYRAVVPHICISTDKDVPTGLYMNPAATLRYGVFANETCLQARMLDMRGYHDLARRYLEPFLYYQGASPIMPGRFGSQHGVLHSAGAHTHHGYDLDHGWVLWTLAEHYRFTRDAEWLRRVAPHLVDGCDWIVQERRSTMRLDADGRRCRAYGLLPPGQLEDGDEWFYWYSVNAYAYRGLHAAAAALAEIGHPEAGRLRDDAATYRADIRASVRESAIVSPVVRLRDGSYVPHVPTRADIRGHDIGWIRDVLYGPTHLIDCGVLEPDGPEAEWILRDLEDNLLLSESHGLGAPGGNWFSRGGITHQPNLLNTPLIYLARDQIPLALRAFYNAFAASHYPDVNVFSEWILAYGIGGGPFYKTPDEAAWIIWLRSLLLLEEGDRLWLGKGTPRRWLEHGKEIHVDGAPTYWGPLACTSTRRSTTG